MTDFRIVAPNTYFRRHLMKKEITTEVTRVDKCILQQCATGCNNATSIAPSGPREVRQPKEANGSIETKQSGER